MPCRDGCTTHTRTVYRTSPEVEEQLDRYARWLCFLCTDVEARKDFPRLRAKPINSEHLSAASELGAWWKEHKEQDAIRLRKEAEERKQKEAEEEAIRQRNAIRQRAIRKLNAEERAALHLD